MLKVLRNKKTAKRIWIGLGIIIMPAFIFWGLGGAIGDKGEKGYAGIIAGKKISNREFKDSLSAVKNMAIMRFGADFAQVVKDEELQNQAWQRLALVYEAKRLNIKASDQEVVERIESYPFFKRDGVFDKRLYNDLLKYLFSTQPRVFEEEARQNIIISKLFQKITNGITVDDKDAQERYIKINSENDPKFKFDEKKFLEEEKAYKAVILEEKKEEYFSKFLAELLK